MKKVIAAAAAFLVAVAPCSMLFASITPVMASASNVQLSAEQTRALFGDDIAYDYWDGSSYVTANLHFYSYGRLQNRARPLGNNSYEPFNPIDMDCVVYSASRSNLSSSTTGYDITAYIKPNIFLGNLDYIRLGFGYSCWIDTSSTPSSRFALSTLSYSQTRYNFTISDGVNSYDLLSQPNISSISSYSTYPAIYNISCYESGINSSSLLGITPGLLIGTTVSAENGVGVINGSTSYPYTLNNPFSFCSDYDTVQNQYLQVKGILFSPNDAYYTSEYSDVWQLLYSNTSTFKDNIYFYILTPTISENYHDVLHPDSSVPDDSYPDYSSQFTTIIEKLDAIVNNGFVIDGALDDLIDIGQGVHGDLQGVNSRLDTVNSNLNKIDSHIQALQIPDLMSQSSGDMSHIAQNESRNNNDLRTADANQQVINSVAAYGDVSIPSLENVHSMPDDFSELWNYTDQDGLSWINPLLYAMPILTLTVGALAYIVFGRAR